LIPSTPSLRILITGASGAGASTLGRALAGELKSTCLDTDDYYWHATQPPYTQTRDIDERLALLLSDLKTAPSAIVAGSVVNWGPDLEDCFNLIVFLYLEASIRIERLKSRELARYGRIDPEFIEWAAQYDTGPPIGRSLAKHRAWLATRRCPILELHGDLSVSDRVQAVLMKLSDPVT
jgi:hypothetical protein